MLRSVLASRIMAVYMVVGLSIPAWSLERETLQGALSCHLLLPGQALFPGQSVQGCSQGSMLVNQSDGRVVFYQNSRPRWQIGPFNQPSGQFIMQYDGNLVLYSSTGAQLWASGTANRTGARLDVERECNLVIRTLNGEWVWDSDTRCVSDACRLMRANDVLYPNQGVFSCQGNAHLVLQGDGNVVLYHDATPLWHSGTAGRAASKLVMQGDGNLVLYDTSGRPLWNSFTYGYPGAIFAMQSDCNAVIYSASGVPIWRTNTWGCIKH